MVTNDIKNIKTHPNKTEEKMQDLSYIVEL